MGRVGWIAAGVAAIIGGMIFQGTIEVGDDSDTRAHIERSAGKDGIPEKIEGKVAGLVDRVVADHGDDFTYRDDDGNELNLDPATKKEMAGVIGTLLKAEAHLAVYDFRDRENTPEGIEARKQRDAAKARVEQLEAQIEAKTGAKLDDSKDERNDIRDEVRDDIRDAVRN